MNIQISEKDHIGKLLAFIACQAKGRFEIQADLVDDAVSALRHFAKDKQVRIELVTPDAERIVLFSVGGAAIGAAVGYFLASFPGALTGGVIGYGLGSFTACVKITIAPSPDGNMTFDLS